MTASTIANITGVSASRSVALVVGLVLLLESRDESEIEGQGRAGPSLPVRRTFENGLL